MHTLGKLDFCCCLQLLQSQPTVTPQTFHKMHDWRFSHQWWWRKSSGMWCHIHTVPDTSETIATSIFRV